MHLPNLLAAAAAAAATTCIVLATCSPTTNPTTSPTTTTTIAATTTTIPTRNEEEHTNTLRARQAGRAKPRPPPPPADAKGYPAWFWKIGLTTDLTALRERAPPFPYKDTPRNPPHGIASAKKRDQVAIANRYIRRCWIIWVHERARLMEQEQVSESDLALRDAVEARKCSDQFKALFRGVEEWLMTVPAKDNGGNVDAAAAAAAADAARQDDDGDDGAEDAGTGIDKMALDRNPLLDGVKHGLFQFQQRLEGKVGDGGEERGPGHGRRPLFGNGKRTGGGWRLPVAH